MLGSVHIHPHFVCTYYMLLIVVEYVMPAEKSSVMVDKLQPQVLKRFFHMQTNSQNQTVMQTTSLIHCPLHVVTCGQLSPNTKYILNLYGVNYKTMTSYYYDNYQSRSYKLFLTIRGHMQKRSMYCTVGHLPYFVLSLYFIVAFK